MEKRDIAIAAGVTVGGYFAYKYGYLPWKRQRELIADMQTKAAEIQAKQGGSIKDAMAKAGSLACQAYAQKYKVDTAIAGPVCNVASKLAIEGAIIVGKGTVKAAKFVGKKTAKAAKAVGKGTKKAAKAVGRGVETATKAVVIKAPKEVAKAAERLVKAAVITAPKATAKAVGKTLRSAAKKLKFW